jgi:hypothetical protein
MAVNKIKRLPPKPFLLFISVTFHVQFPVAASFILRYLKSVKALRVRTEGHDLYSKCVIKYRRRGVIGHV